MFKQWFEKDYPTELDDGKEVTIEVKYSIVKTEALRTASPQTVSRKRGLWQARQTQHWRISRPRG